MLNPNEYRINLNDRNFDLVKVLTKVAKKVSWQYDLKGGCGQCTIDLAMDPDDMEEIISADYDVQIFMEDAFSGTNLVYRGYVETEKPVEGETKSVQLQVFGYSGQLRRVRVAKTYEGMEISTIIKDILDTYVLSDTGIIYDDADIETTSFSVDKVVFDCMADAAIKTLAGLDGRMEWGVDRDRKFFFKVRSSEIRHILRYKIDVDRDDTINDYGSIINRLYIKGGKNEDGVQFEDTINNSESQALYRLRSRIESNSAILTSSVSQRYGAMILAAEAQIQRRGTIKLTKSKRFFEETVPVGRTCLVGEAIPSVKFYGDDDAIYGSFKYGGLASYEIGKIMYEVGDEGMSVNINVGQARPDVAEYIKRLEFEISQIRNVT